MVVHRAAVQERGQAADACRGGKIKLNDTAVKAAKTVRVGDTVSVRQSPVVRSLKVIGLTERRVGPNSSRISQRTSRPSPNGKNSAGQARRE